ncbi:uncharacterized protein LOC121805098 isoform X3 [Salvia splendens]|uniref:uncharacterized protein LOC121805098 isoform X3 n=1 Tax=Salvia splendens TaxID=180675 RepID=UPI001C265BFA|nr:uncharacterized protein LOC121805098 isoform X3 [Salvia splendens]
MEGGFSIREYASRMRSINVVNCWPFDGDFNEQTVKSLLPPIVIKRFTWWLDELSSETAHKLTIHPQKETYESGETSSRNSAEEGVKAGKLKSLKGKMRATKKRSILEIFAVAPPAINPEKVGEEEDDDDDDDNVGSNRASRKKKMKNTDAILRKALRGVKKIKRKKVEKRGDKISVSDKENRFKLKPRTQKSTGNSSLSCSKEVDTDIHDFSSIPKMKPRLQHLGLYKKLVPCNSSKFIEENRHLELPVRSILKNPDREFSLKQSKKCILQETVQLYPQKANKQVTFSENGEVLRINRKPTKSVECFVKQKDCGSDAGNADYAVELEKDSTVLETSGSEDASTRTGKELGAGPETNEEFASFDVDSTTFGKQKYEGEYSTRSGWSDRRAMCSFNPQWSGHGLADAPDNTMDVFSPRFLHMPHDGYYTNGNMKLMTTSSKTTCRRLNKDMGTPRPIFPPLCFKDYLRTHPDASVSHPSNMRGAYKLTQASPENTVVNCAHSIHFQTFPRLSPNELFQTFSSLPVGSQTTDVRGRRINSIDEEFVGLPLNSQGELIALNSSSTREADHMMNSNVSGAQCIGLSLPSNTFSKFSGHDSEYRDLDSQTSSMGQLNLFPVESYVKENAVSVLPSRLGIIESQRENHHLDFLQTNYHPFHSQAKTICRGENQVRRCPENEKFQSTMRLMGKEFEVGGRGIQGFEDGRMWKDKQIIDELHYQNDPNEPSFRQLRETVFYPSEITVNHRSESMYPLPHFDSQTSSTCKSLFLTRTDDHDQKLYTGGLSSGTFSEVYNNKSLFSEPYANGYDSQLFTLELPTAAAPYQELHSDMNPSATHLKNKQNLNYSPKSSIKFPFMHPDLDGNANSSWPPRSSLGLHPSCFDVSERAAQLGNSQSYALGRNHPYLNPGTSCAINGSVSFQSDDFCMFSPLSSGSALQSVAPVPLGPVPYYSGVLPVSTMQRKLGNPNMIKERFKSRIGIRGLDIGKKLNAPFKPLKRPILGFHEGHQRAVRKPDSCVGFEDTVKGMEGAAFEPCSATQSPGFMMSDEQVPTIEDGQTIPPLSGSYVENARTSPIKITAGVKHVINALRQKDHDNTRSTDHDISLSTTNIGFRFSDSENAAEMFSRKAPVFKQ